MALMNCSEFLELYSDYRDGRLEDPAVARAVRTHLSECDACMRYDAAICRGVMALRAAQELEPSRTISYASLGQWPDTAVQSSPTPARFAAALMVAAALALLLWPEAEDPVASAPVARVEPPPPPPTVTLPKPTPLPVREIDPGTRAVQATLRPPREPVPITEWVSVP